MPRILALFTGFSILVTSAVSAEDKVDFEKQIQPIFAQHCAKCHGEKMAAGKMRLHTAAALKEKWDADQELIVAGDPEKSELYQRLTLPEESPKRMPKKADPLPKETLELIAAWIKQGAVLTGGAVVESAPAVEAEAKTEAAAELPLPEVPAAPHEAVDALVAAGAQVMPLFAGSNLLQVSFAHRSEPAGDADMALLSGIAEQVHALNLAGAKPSDAGLAPLAALKNLAELHLERSAISDAALSHLAGLSRLQYLNLYGTEITDAGLKHLAGLKRLRRLYLWQTDVSYDAAMAMEKDTPGLIVNLGYNHPVVVRMRLTKELELVKGQAEEAKAEEAKVQQQLETAKKHVEATNARLAEVEEQLKELDAPATDSEEQAAKPEGEDAAEQPQAAN